MHTLSMFKSAKFVAMVPAAQCSKTEYGEGCDGAVRRPFLSLLILRCIEV